MPTSQPPESSFPLHLRISQQIRSWLEAGRYKPGDRLPSEAQLMQEFEVSRITIRRALANLTQQGLVVAHHGKGVFVKERQRAIYSLSSPFRLFTDDMFRQGLVSDVQTLMFIAVPPPEAVQRALELPRSVTEVYLQKKLFLVDGVSVAWDVTYIVPELGEKLGEELKTNMTFPILEKHGVSLDRIEAILSSRPADPETAAVLGVSLGSPILVYNHRAYTVENRPIVCGETLSNGDRLSYSVSLRKD
jgi:GntR family transcriptional regulator